MTDDLYARLAARFAEHFKDPRGFEYVTGEQVVSRLNEVLGPGGWAFEVREHGCNDEAGELWVLGELAAFIGDQWVRRQQFGSQKINRARDGGRILDYGFDSKGATTDALKKCATLLGVGLYLAEKDGGIPDTRAANGTTPQPQRAVVVPQRVEGTDAGSASQRETPTVVSRVPIKDQAPPVDRDSVRSADDPLWKRWCQVSDRAQELGLKVPAIRLPQDRGILETLGKDLIKGIRLREAELEQLPRQANAPAAPARPERSSVAAGLTSPPLP